MQPTTHSQLLQLYRHEQDIYEFVFLDGSMATVDAWIKQVESITEPYRPEDVVRFIVDSSRVTVPVAFTLLRSQQYVRYHPLRPRTRTAVLYRSNTPRAMLAILHVFLRWLNGSQHEQALFLPAAQREQAIAWLLQDE